MVRDGRIHGGKGRLVDPDIISVNRPGLGLRQPDRADRRMGEHDGRNAGVIQERLRPVVKQALRKPATGSDGHGRQFNPPRVITNRINSRHAGILVLVHHDVALFIGFHARGLKI